MQAGAQGESPVLDTGKYCVAATARTNAAAAYKCCSSADKYCLRATVNLDESKVERERREKRDERREQRE